MDDETSLESYLFYRHRRPSVEPPGMLPAGKDVKVAAKEGYPLAATVFDPPPDKDRAERLVVIASATGVRRRYYAPFAAWLAARGTRVVTFDYRGIGGSRPEHLPSLDASLIDWAELDLGSVLEWAAKTWGNGKTSVMGHSVGGQLLGLLPDPTILRAVVMVSSQSGDYRLWPGFAERAWYGALWHAVVPGLASTFGYLPGALGIGEDLPGGVARQWAAWCRTPGYMVGGDGHSRRELYRRLEAPVLAFGFDDDEYAPPGAVSALLSLYENAPITRRQVPRAEARVGHFGFFRERFRSSLWREAAEFLDEHARTATG
ncbi:MAG TPA: alpha/beta fold hydrolase [Labilithrix sp.]|jgi:predicted alpha/beta hydrolase|nr:alpha/beta fold hydrolase [Labilithrix sp.]